MLVDKIIREKERKSYMVWEIFFGVKNQSAVSRKDRKSCIESGQFFFFSKVLDTLANTGILYFKELCLLHHLFYKIVFTISTLEITTSSHDFNLNLGVYAVV